MPSQEQKKKLLKAKIAVALHDELGRVPKEAEVNQVFLLTRVMYKAVLVLQRGFEMWCNAARQSCMEGGQHDGPDRDHAQDGLGDPRYCAPGGGVARLSRHLQPVVSAA